jgi:hypothetical protein
VGAGVETGLIDVWFDFSRVINQGADGVAHDADERIETWQQLRPSCSRS